MMTTSTRASAVAALLLCLASKSALAADTVIGAIWDVHWRNPDTDKYQNFGLIRCTTDGKVYRDGKVVGTHKNTGLEKVEINITDSGNPRFNGTSKATRVKKAGTIWEGVHKNPKGEELPIRMYLKKD